MIFFTCPECCTAIKLFYQRQFSQSMRESYCSKRPLLHIRKRLKQSFIINSIWPSNNENRIFSIQNLGNLERWKTFPLFNQKDFLPIRIFFSEHFDQIFCFFLNHKLMIIVFNRLQVLDLEVLSESLLIFSKCWGKMFIRIRNWKNTEHQYLISNKLIQNILIIYSFIKTPNP